MSRSRSPSRPLCECGRPALALGRVRARSSRQTRARVPVHLKGHDYCLACYRRMLDGYDAGRLPPRICMDLDNIFTYHPPTAEDLARYDAIRDAAKEFARVLLANTPRCADQTAAVRKVREAVMTANAAVALKGVV